MNKTLLMIVIIAAALLTIGCAMPGQEAAPDKVEIGMTMDEVRTVMDHHAIDYRYVSDPYEFWDYIGEWSWWTFTFTNGIVTDISVLYY